MKTQILLILFIASLILVVGPTFTLAQPYEASFSLQCRSSNNPGDCAIAENQLQLVITDLYLSTYDIKFIFTNTVPEAPSITNIYLDEPAGTTGSSLLDYEHIWIDNTDGVSFSSGANPHDISAGNPISFSADYSANSDSPVAPNGVNPGDSVAFKFHYTDHINDEPNDPRGPFYDLYNAIADGSFSIGLNIQAFGSCGSEAVVLNLLGEGLIPVPEPATMLLLGTGLVGVDGAASTSGILCG